MMDRLKHMKESLMACVEKELCNMAEADTKELGEAIDMIKDLEETIYYCTITKAMEGEDYKEKKESMMYYPMMYYPDPRLQYNDGQIYYDPYRDMDRMNGKMYYNGNSSSGNNSSSNGGSSNSSSNMGSNSSSGGNNARGGGSRGYEEKEYMYPLDMRDSREGRSPISRKGYIEGKEMRHPKEKQMKELEKYMQELTSDITEMIQGTSPEEKQLMQKKIATLAEKVGQVSV